MLQTVSIILVAGGSYILQHRDDRPGIADPGTYGVWGGSVEDDDASIEDAALRELLEETGISCRRDQLVDLGAKEAEARSPHNKGRMVCFHLFAVELPDGTEMQVHEGQKAVSLPRPLGNNPKVNPVARWVIERYESREAPEV